MFATPANTASLAYPERKATLDTPIHWQYSSRMSRRYPVRRPRRADVAGSSLRRLALLVLVGVLALLGTLAYASPLDPTWVSGLWDNGDHDDVVIRITASADVVEAFPLDHTSLILPVDALWYATEGCSASGHTPSVVHARAPPAL